MEFEVYCDESRPDLLCAKEADSKYMLIGSLWLRRDDRDQFKDDLRELRAKHKIGAEAKWQKISPAKVDFYIELVEWFLAQGDALRYRCIAIDRTQANILKFHENDSELAFYRFYYQLLHHWILDFNTYSIFCDFKCNRNRDRLHVLRKCLASSNLSSEVLAVQAIRSRESRLMQLADVLTGAASAKLNRLITPGGAKENVIERLETQLGRHIAHTHFGEPKFNVFVMNLQGGW